MIEFADFECPACGQFARDVLPAVNRDYIATGKIRLAFWHRPLSIHPHAAKAAAVAECAGLQNKFWALHDVFFANQRALDEVSVRRYAEDVLAGAALDTCLGGDVSKRVQNFVTVAAKLDVTATPTIFFGSTEPDGRVRVVHRWVGAKGVTAVGAMLDELLREALPGTK